MKKNFQFYKTIILVVASALTLVAVTFAWFSVSFENKAPQINAAVVGEATLIEVDFYQQDENLEYLPLYDDIKLENFSAGSYNAYRMIVTTKTADKLKLGFTIEGLPENINEDLKSSVQIKYSLHTATKNTAYDGKVTYVGTGVVSKSNGYVSLSELENGVIFRDISLANYQQSSEDTFMIFYEIGLSEDSPTSIEGLESSLGRVKVSAQRVS